MVDAVATQTIQDGQKMVVQKFTNVSDGTGEAAVVKVDVSALAANARGDACTGVTIEKNMVAVHWNESANSFLMLLLMCFVLSLAKTKVVITTTQLLVG